MCYYAVLLHGVGDWWMNERGALMDYKSDWRKTYVIKVKPVSVSSTPPQMLYGLFWDQIRNLWRKDGQLMYEGMLIIP
jgi:hypothetical protein